MFTRAIAFEAALPKYACTLQSHVNLRAGPSTNSQILKSLKKYTPLMIVDHLDDWVQVKGLNFSG